jgi:hypothetical protein
LRNVVDRSRSLCKNLPLFAIVPGGQMFTKIAQLLSAGGESIDEINSLIKGCDSFIKGCDHGTSINSKLRVSSHTDCEKAN